MSKRRRIKDVKTILDVQYQLDEANRTLADIMCMLYSKNIDLMVLKHDNCYAEPIFKLLVELIQENNELEHNLHVMSEKKL